MDFLEKKTYGDRERDEEKRQEFIEKIDRKKPEERVDIDESGIDNRDDYSYGWNEKGQRFYDLKSGKRSIRVSIISGLEHFLVYSGTIDSNGCVFFPDKVVVNM